MAPAVAVIDFYAISPVVPIVGVVPERFAADDLSAMLGRAAAGRITLVPRATVQQAERELRWRDADVLRFARLGDLAQQLRAERLVVGWIKDLTITRGTSATLPHTGSGPTNATAVVVVQVFDVAQRRIVTQTESSGFAMGIVRSVIAEEVLHRALEPVVAPTVATLSAPAR